MNKQHLEIVTIKHKEVEVTVKIDYDTKEISLVHAEPNVFPAKYVAKDWRFSKRGVEFLDGWNDILHAMAIAIEFGREKLEDFIKAEDKHAKNNEKSS